MIQAKRLYELDVLRGLAALGVVLFHYTSNGNGPVAAHTAEYWYNFSSGYYSVELFFMISGFVILMTLEKVKQEMDFIVGRFSRLYPGYWASILFSIFMIMIMSGGNCPFSFKDIVLNLTMLQTFLEIPNIQELYWTLAQELAFYIIMFAFWRFKLLKKIEFISIGWLALIIFFSLLKEYYSFQMPGRIAIVLLLDHGMFFIAGVGFYLIYKHGFKLLPSIIVGLSLLSYLIHKSHGHPQIITFFIIFTLVVAGKIQRISIPPLVFLGTISYSLYLIHGSVGGFVIQYMRYTLGMNINLVLLFAVSASIIVAWAITFGIEKPAMAAIKQFYIKRSNYSSV